MRRCRCVCPLPADKARGGAGRPRGGRGRTQHKQTRRKQESPLGLVIRRANVFAVGVGVASNSVELQEVVDSANPAQFHLVVGHEEVPLPARVHPSVDEGDRPWPLVRLVVL